MRGLSCMLTSQGRGPLTADGPRGSGVQRKRSTSHATGPSRPPQQRIECRAGRRRAPGGSRAVPRDTQGERIMAHLLLIDDDLALTPEQVRQAFPAPAHTVAVTCTGAEGLEHVRARPPDVI